MSNHPAQPRAQQPWDDTLPLESKEETAMKLRMLLAMGLMVSAISALAASPASAQTIANGPYYAVPSWDQTLPASTRFVVLSNFGGAGVLDRETGLVWEKSPRSLTDHWFSAHGDCYRKTVGIRKGWRLPTFQELASLVDGDPANSSGVRLPLGHPFTGVMPFGYWSATTSLSDSGRALVVSFASGGDSEDERQLKGEEFYVWCVRGGQGPGIQ
jgi:hypothetical protein